MYFEITAQTWPKSMYCHIYYAQPHSETIDSSRKSVKSCVRRNLYSEMFHVKFGISAVPVPRERMAFFLTKFRMKLYFLQISFWTASFHVEVMTNFHRDKSVGRKFDSRICVQKLFRWKLFSKHVWFLLKHANNAFPQKNISREKNR